jgi:hypothetical protein
MVLPENLELVNLTEATVICSLTLTAILGLGLTFLIEAC